MRSQGGGVARILRGTTAGLLFHELRLSWRAVAARSGGGVQGLVIAGLVIGLLALFVGVPLGFALKHYQPPISRLNIIITDLGMLAVASLMVSQTLSSATESLYQRGDLDLMFTAPISPQKTLAARFMALAVTVFLTFALMATPLLVPIALIGHPAWLSFYLVLAATALGAAALGLALCTFLFRLIGARHTRAVAQFMAAIIGAGFFLASQINTFFGRTEAHGIWAQAKELALDESFKLPPGADIPLRAMLGEPLVLLGYILGALILFFGVSSWLGARFAADAATASGADTANAPNKARAARWETSAFRATFRKEVRLLWRDAALVSNVLLRTLYVIPLAIIVIRSARGVDSLALAAGAGGLAFMAGQVAGTLAWITISAEEAHDLLAGSPTNQGVFRRAKLAAAYLPLLVFLAPLLGYLVWISPVAGSFAMIGCLAACITCGLINIWYQKPSKRKDFRRRKGSSWFATLAEASVAALIGLATTFAALGFTWAALPALLAVGLMLMLRRSDAQIARAIED
ncbi:MAG: hypothetical protein CFE28_04630 [Alphaproteobacteria bacterium PA2]|nr:MAG: hypothetical protein CFE28_04630 [Alphaproteobacteria bacterium PA2]